MYTTVIQVHTRVGTRMNTAIEDHACTVQYDRTINEDPPKNLRVKDDRSKCIKPLVRE